MRDVAHIRDGFASANQHRAYGWCPRRLDVDVEGRQRVHDYHRRRRGKRMAQLASQSLPPEMKITPLFDQSLFVRGVHSRCDHGRTDPPALLTAAMILLFLGDWRPTIVISISDPAFHLRIHPRAQCASGRPSTS